MKHSGGCHCKAVRYEVEIDLEKPVIVCNCSICQIHGLMLSFVNADSFKLTKGEGSLTEYLFNTETIAHEFCKICGVEVYGKSHNKDGSEGIAVNVRTIDDIDIEKLTIMPFDGKSR